MAAEGPGPMTLGHAAGASDSPPRSDLLPAPGSASTPTASPMSAGPASVQTPAAHDTMPKAWTERPHGEPDSQVEGSSKMNGHAQAPPTREKSSCKSCCRAIRQEICEFLYDFFHGEHLDECCQALADMLPEILIDLAGGEDKDEAPEVKDACSKMKAELSPEHLQQLIDLRTVLDEQELFKKLREFDYKEIDAIDHYIKPVHDERLKEERRNATSSRFLNGTFGNTFGGGSRNKVDYIKSPTHDPESSTPKGTPKGTPKSTPKGDTENGLPLQQIAEVEVDDPNNPHILRHGGPQPQNTLKTFWFRGDKVLPAKADVCHTCGNVFLEESKFCRHCGAKRPEDEIQNQKYAIEFDTESHLFKKKTAEGTEEEVLTEHHKMKDNNFFPWFIVLWTAIIFGLWLFGALFQDDQDDVSFWERLAGLESFAAVTGYSNLQMVDDLNCGDLRWEGLWRVWTYQYTHIGFVHVLSNSIMNLVFGIRLERLHGTMRMALMYNLGVVGGAVVWYISIVHGSVVGMSGGCYSLLGMHAGYLIINWPNKRKKHKWLTLLVLVVWFVVDVTLVLNDYFSPRSSDAPTVSVAVHIGGAITGFLVALALGENIVVTSCEEKIKYFSIAIGVLGLIFCLVWILPIFPPSSILEPNLRWCWMRQIYNRSYFNDSSWHCVRCKEKACIDSWGVPNQQWVSQVTRTLCEKDGWTYTEN